MTTSLPNISFVVPVGGARPHQTLPYAALAQSRQGRVLWTGQNLSGDPHQPFVYAAAAGFAVPTGIGVSLMPLRHPYDAAVQAQAMATATGHPVVAGYGPGSKHFQARLLGAPYASQLGASREYLTILRGLLSGAEVDVGGDFFSFRGALPKATRPRIEAGLGVLRPGMARVAGEVADVAITWLTPAPYIRDVILPALREGAAAADRPTPRVVAMVPVARSAPNRDLTALVLAGNRPHLLLPHYQDMLRRAGIDVDVEGAPADSARALAAGGAFLFGGDSELRDQLGEFAAAGVDEVVLNTAGVHGTEGPRAALHELQALLDLSNYPPN
ncbi:LLM class flavin-dependent oxidoreductase [Streptomyces bacillaris]|uniref:LLM class flavin-dependent oxidoreductase n=1 Tax=Streptomyces bacillaris TaxID=68179 RepID=UPI00369EB0FB